jgi:short-subunit dehydrogenase
MVAGGTGRVLFTSSIASTMPGPYQAVYNASKSFIQSFALALRNELKDSGVTKTKAQGRAGRALPDSVKAEMHRKQAEPGSA